MGRGFLAHLRRDQGRHHARRRRSQGTRRVGGLPALGRGEVTRDPRRRPARPVPVPPSRPHPCLRRHHAGTEVVARRRPRSRDRHLERECRRDPDRFGRARRSNLASVQNEFSPKHPGSIDELRFCAAHDIAFLPWSPLGGTGGGASSVGDRFSAFRDVGDAHGVSPQQVVLAWELALDPHVIPIPGARRAAPITDSAKAADLELTPEEVTRLSESVAIFD